MFFENISIGTDIEDIKRFKGKSLENDARFFELIFTSKELEYCFKSAHPEGHLCGRFCAKEAVVKALSPLGITDVLYNEIEVLNSSDGYLISSIAKYPNISIKISISHCKDYATATALVFKK